MVTEVYGFNPLEKESVCNEWIEFNWVILDEWITINKDNLTETERKLIKLERYISDLIAEDEDEDKESYKIQAAHERVREIIIKQSLIFRRRKEKIPERFYSLNPRGKKCHNYTEEQKHFAMKRAQKIGIKATSKLLMIPRRTIQRWVKKYGIRIPRCPLWVYFWVKYDPYRERGL